MKRFLAASILCFLASGALGQNAPNVAPRSTPVVGTFTTSGVSSAFQLTAGQNFNVSIDAASNFAGNILLERMLPGDTTWRQRSRQWGNYSAPMQWGSTLGSAIGISDTFQETEPNTQYRLECVSCTAGSANYRISQ